MIVNADIREKQAHPHEPWMIYRRYCEAGKQDDHWIIYSYGDTMDPKIYAQVA